MTDIAAKILCLISAIWIIGGSITGGIFYASSILPAKNPYKSIVGIIACGPISWIVVPIVYGARKLATWLEDVDGV